MNNIAFLNNLKTKRRRVAEREGSPPYTWTPVSIAASSFDAIECESQFPQGKKYMPFNYIKVDNTDVVNLRIWLNGRAESFIVPASSIIPFRRPAINQIEIENLSAAVATTAGQVTVTVLHEPRTADDVAREAV